MKSSASFSLALSPLLAFLLLFLTETVQAQNKYALEVKPAKKILHVSELNLPASTTLGEILEVFPELLAREGDSRLDNYDIRIGDRSLGPSGKSFLNNIFLYEIKDIEVSQSPEMSQQVKGQGGVIKIVLKQPDEGLGGMASLEAGSLASLNPGLRLNYHKGGLTVGGHLSFGLTHPHDNNSITYEHPAQESESVRNDTIDNYKGTQLAGILAVYKPDDVSTYEAWVWEHFTRDLKDNNIILSTGTIDYRGNDFLTDNSFSFSAGTKYKRRPEKYELQIQAEYSLSDGSNSESLKYSSAYKAFLCNTDWKTHTLNTFVKYKRFLLPATSSSKASLLGGVNFNHSGDRYGFLEKNLTENVIDADARRTYISPFIEFEALTGNFEIKAGVRYQHHITDVHVTGTGSSDKTARNVTCNFDFGWQMAPHHHLNLMLDRSIKRPSTAQIFPFCVYDSSTGGHSLGNLQLEPSVMHTVLLGYVTDAQTESGHSFVTYASLRYINDSGLITSVYQKNNIRTYANDGKSDILSANAMLLYSHNIFSMSLTANVFGNSSTIGSKTDRYFYYNLALIPRLAFSDGWRMSAKFVFNSPVSSVSSVLGSYFYSKVMVSKSWEKWTGYVAMDDIYHNFVQDKAITPERTTIKYYNLHRPSLSVGATFAF